MMRKTSFTPMRWLSLTGERQIYDMIQVPVLALPTPCVELTHGVYCDDFAEYQSIDMRARQISRAFLPSNGVGTAYSRDVLDRLAETNSNRVFDPSCLTEDYESGVRIHVLGYSQRFCVLESSRRPHGNARILSKSILERCPAAHALGDGHRAAELGNAIAGEGSRGRNTGSGVTVKACGQTRWALSRTCCFLRAYSRGCGRGRRDGARAMRLHSPIAIRLTAGTLLLQFIRLAIRMECVRRIYGGPFALLVPLRLLHENAINGLATVWAVLSYTHARLRHRPLVWLKTEHAYPNRESSTAPPRDLRIFSWAQATSPKA